MSVEWEKHWRDPKQQMPSLGEYIQVEGIKVIETPLGFVKTGIRIRREGIVIKMDPGVGFDLHVPDERTMYIERWRKGGAPSHEIRSKRRRKRDKYLSPEDAKKVYYSMADHPEPDPRYNWPT